MFGGPKTTIGPARRGLGSQGLFFRGGRIAGLFRQDKQMAGSRKGSIRDQFGKHNFESAAFQHSKIVVRAEMTPVHPRPVIIFLDIFLEILGAEAQ
jgi:hypothetical protein